LLAVTWTSIPLLANNEVPPSRVLLLNHGINMCNLLHAGNKFNSFQPDDLKKLKAMGISNVRIPVEIGYILPGLSAPGASQPSTPSDVDQALTSLDKYVEGFESSGFPVTLTLFMHDEMKKLGVEQSKALMLQAMDVLTLRYAKKYTPDQLFFDVNEPQYDAEVWNEIAPILVADIRKNAPTHTILIEPSHTETRFIAMLKPVPDSNVIYAMHIYYPSNFTLQGQPGQSMPDPNLRFPDAQANEEKLEAWMRKGIDWAQSNKVPLIMNEFGCSNSADSASRLTWIKAVRRLAEKYNLPWSYWSFSGKRFGLKPSLTSDYDPALIEALSVDPVASPGK
jgi:endoglucanase